LPDGVTSFPPISSLSAAIASNPKL
jgi:hypothetical protein